MREPQRFEHDPSHWHPAGQTTLPSYSSCEDVCQRLRARRGRRLWWRADGSSYNILGHLMVVIPTLLACLGVLYLGIRFDRMDIALLVLSSGVIVWYFRDAWRLH